MGRISVSISELSFADIITKLSLSLSFALGDTVVCQGKLDADFSTSDSPRPDIADANPRVVTITVYVT